MMKIILPVLFSISFAQAAFIQSGSFNPATQNLELNLVYSGGLKSHDFSLDWDKCQELNGQLETAARLIDTGWDDTGKEELSQVVSFNLSEVQCKPAQLTIFSDRHSRLTLWIQ